MVSLTCTALLEIQKMAFEKERRELLEAALFEARVAEKLATLFQYVTMDAPYDHEQEIPCNDCPMEHKCTLDCKESVLKYARLEVEEEMDAAV